jgi:glycosyltransferase involved in cell wall biosynthesis
MSTAPVVTVLMAVHDGASYVAEAIESILAQTWRDFEFLILDDASTDATAEIVRRFSDPRIRLLQNDRNLGLAATLNRGLREARGQLIARQDDDDLSEPSRLARQVGFLQAHPGVALVGAQGWSIGPRKQTYGRIDTPLESGSIRWGALFLNPIVHSAVLFRRAVFLDALGGYDESYDCCQDYELWTRATERYALRNLPQRLVRRRVHARSVSHTRAQLGARLSGQVLQRLLPQLAPGQEFTAAEIALLLRLRTGIEPAEIGAMRELIARLLPATCVSADLRRTMAWVYAHLGYSMLPLSAVEGLRDLFRAVRISPRYGLTLPWAMICALAILGDKGRRLVDTLRGA